MSNISNCSGIYKIDFGSSKVYIGSAKNLRKRFNIHISSLRRGTSNCKKLQLAYNKYGESALNFTIVCLCSIPELPHLESSAIEMYDAVNSGYNIAIDTLVPMLGRKHSQTTKTIMSVMAMGNRGNSGKTFSPEHRERIRLALLGKNKGRKMTKEFCEANRERNIGSNNPFFGRTHSEETKLKIRKSKLGK